MYARCQHGIDKRGGRLKVVFLWCDAKNTANILLAILPGFRGKVGGLLHRSRENAAFSAIIPEFCSVFQGVLQWYYADSASIEAITMIISS